MRRGTQVHGRNSFFFFLNILKPGISKPTVTLQISNNYTDIFQTNLGPGSRVNSTQLHGVLASLVKEQGPLGGISMAAGRRDFSLRAEYFYCSISKIMCVGL